MRRANTFPNALRRSKPQIPTLNFATLAELHGMLMSHPKKWGILSGVENGPAGLDPDVDPGVAKAFAQQGCQIDSVANSFSFCVNGRTWTAFENPEDGYRSSLGLIAMREGNYCSTTFPSVALTPRLEFSTYKDAVLLLLVHPATQEIALQVGTQDHDDYYPCFVASHDPKVLSSAGALNLILADDLNNTLPKGRASPKSRL